MSLCLYECLRAVDLHHHHARFTSVGIRHAAHLSFLTMEDYAILGITSMEERTRLFNLVQVVKTLDLDSLEYEDGDIDEDYAVADNSLSYDRDPDEDVLEGDLKGACESSSKPSTICRRLDFSSEAVDPHQKLVDSSHPRNDDLGLLGSGSDTSVQLQRTSNPKTKPRPATVSINALSNKLVHHKARRDRASEHNAKPTPVYESKRTAGYNYGLPLSSPSSPIKNRQPGGQRISVCVRKRPLTRTESRRGEPDVVTTPSRECVIVHEAKEAVDLTQYILQHRFYFDQVFGEESSNEEVYLRTAYPLVQHMLSGGKATCFAYGQTGAGKTHTMLGSSPGRPGLYALAVRDIFAHLSTTHTRSPLLVYVSFFEIYCGQLYDLLDHRKRLFAREDGQKTVHIAGLRDVRVDSVRSLLEVISQGTEERTQGVSGVNPHSSRSHALLQIQLRDVKQQIFGRMWFVDLAGSERASDTKEPDRQTRMEGAEINQSLLALKECIRSLDQEQLHTPFRQSKLTQVLKDSFVGDSMTCMIANISPGHLATEHTLNTLRYADRVKELKGQGGQRGGRRGRTVPSPKRNLSNSSSSSSSIGTRGKSPPKKPKLVRQRQAFGPTTPTTSPARKGAVLCSTPKDSRRGEDISSKARMGIGLEDITPIRGLLGIDDKKKGEERRRERYGDSAGPSIAGRNVRAGMVLGQAVDEELDLWEPQRGSGFNHGAKQNLKSHLKDRKDVERIQMGQGEIDRLGDLEKVGDKERKKHLRQYHQQLQQFTPLSTSSSSALPLSLSSTYPSFSSSDPTTLSSTVSPSSCPSSLSLSALMCHGLDEVLDSYGARVEVRSDGNMRQLSFVHNGEICSLTETSPRNKDQGDDLRVSGVGTEALSGKDRSINVKRRSLEGTIEGEVRERREDWRPAAVTRGGGAGWAWVSTTETEQADGTTGVRPADALARLFNNCDSGERREVGEEGRDASDVPADGAWITEEREESGDYSSVSSHGNNDSLFNRPPVESSCQRAPAERPLSPPCEHTNTPLTPNKHTHLSLKTIHAGCASSIVPLSSENVQQGVPSNSCGKKEITFAAEASTREFPNARWATPPLTTRITQNECNVPSEDKVSCEDRAKSLDHNQPEVTAKTSIDSLSYNMEPLSISLLEVDCQAAAALFFQGEQSNTSENNKRGRGDKNKEFLSLLEWPQGKTSCPPNSQRKDMCCPSAANSQECIDNQQNRPIMNLVLEHEQLGVVQAHLEQLEEMTGLCHKEGMLLCQQPDMAFGDYVHRLEEIMKRKAQCVHSMIAQLQPYLKATSYNNPHKEEDDPNT